MRYELFGAVLLEPQQQRELTATHYPLVAEIPGIKLHLPSRLHITLFHVFQATTLDMVYIDRTIDDLLYETRNELPPFKTTLAGFGHFPQNGSVHIKICPASERAEESPMRSLANLVRDRLTREGVPIWKKYPFSGFVTLGRVPVTGGGQLLLPTACPPVDLDIASFYLLSKWVRGAESGYNVRYSYQLRRPSRHNSSHFK